jgi:hypothetical protein
MFSQMVLARDMGRLVERLRILPKLGVGTGADAASQAKSLGVL